MDPKPDKAFPAVKFWIEDAKIGYNQKVRAITFSLNISLSVSFRPVSVCCFSETRACLVPYRPPLLVFVPAHI
jgi:hypothetical protein